jgi:hypothetical protein
MACALAIAWLASSAGREANAAIVFNLGNAAIQGVTGPGANQLTTPYATLDIVGDTTLGQVTFTLSTSAHNANAPINAVFNDVDFNTNLVLNTDFTLLSASNGGTIGPAGNISDFGTFDYQVGGSGNSARDQPYVFVLQLTNFSQATAGNFTVANSDGNYFAAHIFTDIGNGGTTGFIATNSIITPAAVPEPSTVALALTGLIPLGIAGTRRLRGRTARNVS